MKTLTSCHSLKQSHRVSAPREPLPPGPNSSWLMLLVFPEQLQSCSQHPFWLVHDRLTRCLKSWMPLRERAPNKHVLNDSGKYSQLAAVWNPVYLYRLFPPTFNHWSFFVEHGSDSPPLMLLTRKLGIRKLKWLPQSQIATEKAKQDQKSILTPTTSCPTEFS